jgi:catechol 2,3-dioxygenase-like lactoylglutathione lyase family enzyme
MTVQFERAVPIFRIFSLDKAREFYLDFLGFKVDWEHRFEPGGPVYMQISRNGLVIHLSEHHGQAVCLSMREASLSLYSRPKPLRSHVQGMREI